MRVIGMTLGLMALILAFGFTMERVMDYKLSGVEAEVRAAERHIKNGGWEAAAVSAKRAEQKWERAQKIGSVLFHNQSLDNMSHSLRLLGAELESRDTRDSLRAARYASGLIGLMRGSDNLSLGNLM
ncbi:MAG: DUF4363 family protein [Oscillospiraceae bacterium]|nr:DUF4363 family protein [Oscillospiraceae bacterium]